MVKNKTYESITNILAIASLVLVISSAPKLIDNHKMITNTYSIFGLAPFMPWNVKVVQFSSPNTILRLNHSFSNKKGFSEKKVSSFDVAQKWADIIANIITILVSCVTAVISFFTWRKSNKEVET